MNNISKDTPHLKTLVFEHVKDIQSILSGIEFGDKFKCKKCGQMTFIEPVEYDRCGFCGSMEKHGFEVIKSDHK